MRITTTGKKLYCRKGIEGYSLDQIKWALRIKQEIVEDLWMRKQAGELGEAEIKAAREVLAHREAGWWIQRREWTIWRHFKEQSDALLNKGEFPQ